MCNDASTTTTATSPIPIQSYHRGRFADWDYLVILDACRYDVFAEVVTELDLPGTLTKADSGAVNTSFWLKQHWSREDTDAILITANPWSFKGGASGMAHERFKRAIWADPEGKDVKGYKAIRERIQPLCGRSGGFGVFHPKIALECFLAYKEQGHRYVIHLIPPHLPFLGEKGSALFARLKLAPHNHGGIYRAIRNYGRRGNWKELRECYKENIIVALQSLQDYAELFSNGRLVISADHGELIGEPMFDRKGMYWHKISGSTWEEKNSIREMLQTVPWFETEIVENPASTACLASSTRQMPLSMNGPSH